MRYWHDAGEADPETLIPPEPELEPEPDRPDDLPLWGPDIF